MPSSKISITDNLFLSSEGRTVHRLTESSFDAIGEFDGESSIRDINGNITLKLSQHQQDSFKIFFARVSRAKAENREFSYRLDSAVRELNEYLNSLSIEEKNKFEETKKKYGVQ